MSPASQTPAERLLTRFLGILPSTPEEKILRMLIEIGCEVVGGQEGSLLVPDDDGKSLHFVMTVGDEESAKKLEGQKVPLGAGLTGLPRPPTRCRPAPPLTPTSSKGSAKATVRSPMP